MGGVDVRDKSVHHNSCNRKTNKTQTSQWLARMDFLISVLEDLAKDPDDPVVGSACDGDHRIDKFPGEQLRICVVCRTGRFRFICPGLQLRISKRVFL